MADTLLLAPVPFTRGEHVREDTAHLPLPSWDRRKDRESGCQGTDRTLPRVPLKGIPPSLSLPTRNLRHILPRAQGVRQVWW